MSKTLLVTLFCIALSACTWVKLNPQGESVRVSRPAEVASCERLGEVTASVLDKVAFMKRSRKKQVTELETLARNEAAAMDGDAVVAVSDIADGRRQFAVYRCN